MYGKDNDQYIKTLRDTKSWLDAIPHNELSYAIERLEYFSNELFEYSKFKIGDEIILKETPEISENVRPGWIGHKDILIKGQEGIVVEVDHYKGKFRYGINIIGSNGGIFTFYEGEIVSKHWNEEENE